MTLTLLLQINMRLVKPDEFGSVGMAERIWREHGCPTGVRELIDLLETVLSECREGGIRYAPILLQRKKALHRGTWEPLAEQIAVVRQQTELGGNEGQACSKCGGTGVMYGRGGRSATLCPCGAWKKQLLKPA
jgi:hypothetical protein